MNEHQELIVDALTFSRTLYEEYGTEWKVDAAIEWVKGENIQGTTECFGWQSMDSAPKNKRILLCSGNEIYVGHYGKSLDTGHEAWIVGCWRVSDDSDNQLLLHSPQQWMPLPELPKTGE